MWTKKPNLKNKPIFLEFKSKDLGKLAKTCDLIRDNRKSKTRDIFTENLDLNYWKFVIWGLKTISEITISYWVLTIGNGEIEKNLRRV